jgi:hypothetical protein
MVNCYCPIKGEDGYCLNSNNNFTKEWIVKLVYENTQIYRPPVTSATSD